MNRRDEAIRSWFVTNRPDDEIFLRHLDYILSNPQATDSLYRLLAIGFAAGREFERVNPDAPDNFSTEDRPHV